MGLDLKMILKTFRSSMFYNEPGLFPMMARCAIADKPWGKAART